MSLHYGDAHTPAWVAAVAATVRRGLQLGRAEPPAGVVRLTDYTGQLTALGTVQLLAAIRPVGLETRFQQPSNLHKSEEHRSGRTSRNCAFWTVCTTGATAQEHVPALRRMRRQADRPSVCVVAIGAARAEAALLPAATLARGCVAP
jgi:hypothetical protein